MLNLKNRSGFTLVELSIVLAIISVFLGMILLSTEARISEAKLYATKEKMQVILDAMDKYVKTYGHIPCPTGITLARTDPNYGLGLGSNNTNPPNGTAGNCSGSIALITISSPLSILRKGAVPFKELGLDADAVVDGWGNRFTYLAVQWATTSQGFQGIDQTPGMVRLYSDAAFTVPSNGMSSGHADAPSFILISHGANGYGAYLDKDGSQLSTSGASAAELANATSTPVTLPPGTLPLFSSMPQTKNFDDIVIMRERWQFPPYFYNH